MKKLTALLALFLLLTLLAQGACAALKLSLWSGGSPALIRQDSSVVTGNLDPNTSVSQYAIRLSSTDTYEPESLSSTFHTFYNKQPSVSLDSGYTRKALLVDIQLMSLSSTDPDADSVTDQDYDEVTFAPNARGTYSPVIPLSNFIPEGTTFKNLRVFHYREEGDASEWEKIDSALHRGKVEFNKENGTFGTFNTDNVLDTQNNNTSNGNLRLRLTVNYGFSPFVIVWDELNTGTPDVPQTGDSAPLALWLLLLGGACAMLALRRRSQRAS